MLPGIIAIKGPAYTKEKGSRDADELCAILKTKNNLEGFPLVILCDDPDFVSNTLNNFLWVTFTRSNPSHDMYGVDAFVEHKHWGCRGSLVIDARIKPHHAPPLIEDPKITARVDALGKSGGPLAGII